jgi:hypothetical protein
VASGQWMASIEEYQIQVSMQTSVLKTVVDQDQIGVGVLLQQSRSCNMAAAVLVVRHFG